MIHPKSFTRSNLMKTRLGGGLVVPPRLGNLRDLMISDKRLKKKKNKFRKKKNKKGGEK